MKSRYIRFIVLGLALTPFLLLAGCWSSLEINSRAFVNIMLIDTTDNGETQLTLGFQLPNRMIPGQGGGSGQTSGEPYAYISKTGITISDAYRKIQNDLSRKISFGQAHIIVIGKKLAKQGIDPVLEFVQRQPAFHINANLFVTQDEVLDIINAPTLFERFASSILLSYIDEEVALNTTVRDFLVARYKMGDALLPELVFKNNPGLKHEKESKSWMGSGGAIIFRNGKMVSPTMDSDEMRASLWILSQIKTSVLNMESPTDGKMISFFLEKMKTKTEPRLEDQSAAFTVKSHTEAYVLASESTIDLDNDKNIELLRKELEVAVKSRIQQTIAKTRQARADVFRLGEKFDWKYPTAWKILQPSWRNLYANELPIDVVVEIELLRTGGAYRSIKDKSKF